MLDIREILQDPDSFQHNCRLRRCSLNVSELIASYQHKVALEQKLQQLQQQRNKLGQGQPANDQERMHRVQESRRLKEALAQVQQELEEAEARYTSLMLQMPNRTHPHVPEGGEEGSCELRRFGAPAELSFEPKDHLSLATAHDLIDFEMGLASTGQKFYFLKNQAVFLELALLRYALDLATGAGFRPLITPDLAKNQVLEGIGFAPRGPESQVYRIEEHDMSLIATAEIAIGGAYAGKIFEAKELPLLLAGISHCFRTESGSHGRESRGLYRVHQFSKVELFVFCLPEESDYYHDKLLNLEEQLFQGLELPYRVVDIASGDLGASAYRKFDLEAWMAGRGDYGEVTSTSNCLDFQSRRLKIRYRKPDGELGFVHTLNGTAIAVSRAIVALLEAGQQADGSIIMPKVLLPYLPFDRITSAI